MSKLPIETENPLFGLYLYPTANNIREKQQDIGWFAHEIKVEKDTHDFMHTMPKYSRNAVEITLQTFVEIEQGVGDVWSEIESWFPHSELIGCSSAIASMEKSVHSFFYQRMSDVLNIDPKTTAKNQQKVKVIKNKLEFIKRITSNLAENKPLALATVALIEQVLLFSNFGLLKSFKANGNNSIQNTLTGVDYVVNDEVLHGVYASYLHQTYIQEMQEAKVQFNVKNHITAILLVVDEIILHEDSIIDYMYLETDLINDISSNDLKQFVRSRANSVLLDLGYEERFIVTTNPIAAWFYKGANSIKLHDFFVAGTNQYSRDWSLASFTRLPFLKGESNDN